jgi:hypothetical protein
MEVKTRRRSASKSRKSRFLVSFEGFYANDPSFYDLTVEWNEEDPEELRDMLKEYIRGRYCNGRKDINIYVTILSVFKLKHKKVSR